MVLWPCWAAEHWGYPLTLTADTVFGLFCLACLPFMKPPEKSAVRAGSAPAAGAEVPEAISP